MKSDFQKEWTAVCPKCDCKLTHADFSCKNCGRGKVKLYVIDAMSRFWGCERCGQSHSDIKCPTCNASINKDQTKVAGCFVATAMFGYESKITVALRWFRDAFLIKVPGGRSFVFWYYEKSQKLLSKLNHKK